MGEGTYASPTPSMTGTRAVIFSRLLIVPSKIAVRTMVNIGVEALTT